MNAADLLLRAGDELLAALAPPACAACRGRSRAAARRHLRRLPCAAAVADRAALPALRPAAAVRRALPRA